jgi:hypothetical protein
MNVVGLVFAAIAVFEVFALIMAVVNAVKTRRRLRALRERWVADWLEPGKKRRRR